MGILKKSRAELASLVSKVPTGNTRFFSSIHPYHFLSRTKQRMRGEANEDVSITLNANTRIGLSDVAGEARYVKQSQESPDGVLEPDSSLPVISQHLPAIREQHASDPTAKGFGGAGQITTQLVSCGRVHVEHLPSFHPESSAADETEGASRQPTCSSARTPAYYSYPEASDKSKASTHTQSTEHKFDINGIFNSLDALAPTTLGCETTGLVDNRSKTSQSPFPPLELPRGRNTLRRHDIADRRRNAKARWSIFSEDVGISKRRRQQNRTYKRRDPTNRLAFQPDSLAILPPTEPIIVMTMLFQPRTVASEPKTQAMPSTIPMPICADAVAGDTISEVMGLCFPSAQSSTPLSSVSTTASTAAAQQNGTAEASLPSSLSPPIARRLSSDPVLDIPSHPIPPLLSERSHATTSLEESIYQALLSTLEDSSSDTGDTSAPTVPAEPRKIIPLRRRVARTLQRESGGGSAAVAPSTSPSSLQPVGNSAPPPGPTTATGSIPPSSDQSKRHSSPTLAASPTPTLQPSPVGGYGPPSPPTNIAVPVHVPAESSPTTSSTSSALSDIWSIGHHRSAENASNITSQSLSQQPSVPFSYQGHPPQPREEGSSTSVALEGPPVQSSHEPSAAHMAAVNPCSRSLANGDISQLGSPAEPAIFIVSDSSSSSMPEDVGPGANFEPSAPSTVQLGFAAVAPGPPYPITPIPIQATGTFGNDGALPSSSFPTPSIQPQNAPVMDAGMQPGDAYAPSEHYMVPVEEAAVPLSSHPVFPPFAAAPEAQSSSWTIPQSAPYHEMLHEEDDDDMELVCTIDPHDNGQIHPGVSLNGIAVEAGIQYPQAITSQLTLPYINTDGSFPTIVFVDDPQVPIAPIAATTNPMPHLDPGVSMDFQTPQSFPDAGPAFSTGSLRNALPEVITAHSSATSTMQFIVTDDTGIGPAAQKSSRISADPFPPANNETSTSSSQMPHSPLRGTEVKDQQTDLASFLGSSAHPNASPTSVEHGTEVPGAGSCRPEIPTADDLRSSQDATPATTTSATECATALPYACYSVASPSKGDDINGATSDLFPSIVAPDEAVSTCLPPTTEEPPAVPVAPPRTPTSNEGCATTSCPVSDDVTAQQPIISKSATPAKPARGKRRGSPPRSGPSRIECVNGSFAAASSSASTTVPEENGEARQHTSSNTATSSFEEAQPEAAPASPPAVSATEPIAGSTPQPTPSVPPEAPEAHFSKSQPDGKPAASRVEPFHDDEFTIDVLEAYVMMEYQYCHKRTIEKRGKPGRTDPLLWMAKACALQRRIRAIQNNALRNGVAKDEVVAGLKQSSGGAGMAWRLSRVFLGLPDEPKLTRIEGAMHDDPCIPGVEEYPDILALMSLSLHDGVYDPDRVPK